MGAATEYPVTLAEAGAVEVSVAEYGSGQPFRFDPAALPPAARAVAAGNRAALAAYAGDSMSDPSPAGRLGTLEIPTLMPWGGGDRIVDTDYGRAYAAAIPPARFQLLAGTGHCPQLETPDQVLYALRDSADLDLSAAR